jgi:hypothetical protein
LGDGAGCLGIEWALGGATNRGIRTGKAGAWVSLGIAWEIVVVLAMVMRLRQNPNHFDDAHIRL